MDQTEFRTRVTTTMSIASSSRVMLSLVSLPARRHASTSVWPSRTHLRKPPTIPAPLPPMYAQKVVLSDGSTFTAYTTAPTPQIIRLTRDVSNNPLWAPGTDKRGLGDGSEEGRVGRFRRRFGGVEENETGETEEPITALDDAIPPKRQEAFGLGDFDWMSEGATEEKFGSKDAAAKGKAGKRK